MITFNQFINESYNSNDYSLRDDSIKAVSEPFIELFKATIDFEQNAKSNGLLMIKNCIYSVNIKNKIITLKFHFEEPDPYESVRKQFNTSGMSIDIKIKDQSNIFNYIKQNMEIFAEAIEKRFNCDIKIESIFENFKSDFTIFISNLSDEMISLAKDFDVFEGNVFKKNPDIITKGNLEKVKESFFEIAPAEFLDPEIKINSTEPNEIIVTLKLNPLYGYLDRRNPMTGIPIKAVDRRKMKYDVNQLLKSFCDRYTCNSEILKTYEKEVGDSAWKYQYYKVKITGITNAILTLDRDFGVFEED